MKDFNYILNDLFKKIRLDLGYTQKEFAEILVCTQELVSRIENNKRTVSAELLSTLSNIAKVDLHSNISDFSKFDGFLVFEKYYELLSFQDLNNENLLLDLEKSIQDPILDIDFNNGELLLLKNLSISIVECFLRNDFDKAIKYSLDNLGMTEESVLQFEYKTLKSPFFYNSLSVLSVSYFSIGKIDIALTIVTNGINQINTVWNEQYFKYTTNSMLYKQSYLFLHILYAFMLFKVGQYEKSLEICDFAIAKCGDFNILNLTVFALFIKWQTQYMLNNIEDAKQTLLDVTTIRRFTRIPTHMEIFTEFNPEDYPKITANVTPIPN